MTVPGLDRIINLNLMLHPVNWLLVWIILTMAGYAWHVIHDQTSAPARLSPGDD